MQDLLFLLLLGIGFGFWSKKAGDYHDCSRKLLAMPVAPLCNSSSLFNRTWIITRYLPIVHTPTPHPVVDFRGSSYHDYHSKSDLQKTALIVYQHPHQLPPLAIRWDYVTWTVVIVLCIVFVGFQLLHRHASSFQKQKKPKRTNWNPIFRAIEDLQDLTSESEEEIVQKEVEGTGCKECESFSNSFGLLLRKYCAMENTYISRISNQQKEISDQRQVIAALKQKNSTLKVRVSGLRTRINPVVRQNIVRKFDLAYKVEELARLRERVKFMEVTVHTIEIQYKLASKTFGEAAIANSKALNEGAWAEHLGRKQSVGSPLPKLKELSNLPERKRKVLLTVREPLATSSSRRLTKRAQAAREAIKPIVGRQMTGGMFSVPVKSSSDESESDSEDEKKAEEATGPDEDEKKAVKKAFFSEEGVKVEDEDEGPFQHWLPRGDKIRIIEPRPSRIIDHEIDWNA